MKPFAELLERLLYSPQRNAKLALLEDYFRRVPDPDAPGRQPDPAGEGRQWWEKDANRHREDREQTNMAPDDLRSNEV